MPPVDDTLAEAHAQARARFFDEVVIPFVEEMTPEQRARLRAALDACP